jgi:hypothetical protein
VVWTGRGEVLLPHPHAAPRNLPEITFCSSLPSCLVPPSAPSAEHGCPGCSHLWSHLGLALRCIPHGGWCLLSCWGLFPSASLWLS